MPKLAEPEPFDWVDDNRGAQMLGFVGSLVVAFWLLMGAAFVVVQAMKWVGWWP